MLRLLPFLLAARAVHADELEVLAEFFRSTGGSTVWKNRTGWLEHGVDYCHWYGVTCGSANDEKSSTSITAIELPDNRLAGFIPTSFFDSLTSLEVFDLHDNPGLNGAAGEMTATSAQKQLQVLDLSETALRVESLLPLQQKESGVAGLAHVADTLQVLKVSPPSDKALPPARLFPAETLARLTNLRTLEMPNNNYVGSLVLSSEEEDSSAPSSFLDHLTLLQRLDLSNNALAGELPEFGKITPQLRHLALNNNLFTGNNLATSMNDAVNLVTVQLRDNSLRGPLPALAEAVGLKRLELQNNALTGPIPDNFLQHTTTAATNNESSILIINLHANQLTGTLPAALARFRALNLDVTNNSLTGTMPASYAQQSAWMDGGVAVLGGDAILCPPGTFHPEGRARIGAPCAVCNKNDEQQRMGRTECGPTMYSAAAGNSPSVDDDPLEQQVRILAQLYAATSTPDHPWLHKDGWKQLDEIIAASSSPHWDLNTAGIIDVCQF